MIKELRPTDLTSIGPYRLIGRLGAGGMGQVYLARSQAGRLVAVKVIRPELAEERGFRARFAREIAVAKNVSGLYTAAVVDSDSAAELPWMATAYVPGPSLADAVHDSGPLSVKSVLALAAGLAEAIAGIHRAGVVHRDLKPSNVLLAAEGPRVIDFGISRAVERSMLTTTGLVLGSPGFMSPEQARGQREVGEPTDVFSLGAVLAFAATGNGPFGAGPTPALLYRVVNEEPDLSQVPGRLRPLIERCLVKDPAERPTPAGIFGLLGDEAEALTGEWLPKSIVDTLGRYDLTTELPEPPADAPEPARSAAVGREAGATGSAAREPATEGATAVIAKRPAVTAEADAAELAGAPPLPPAGRASRGRDWRWPASAVAVGVVVAALATILVTSFDDTPRQPASDPTPSLARITIQPTAPSTVTSRSSGTPAAKAKPKKTARTASGTPSATISRPVAAPLPTQPLPSPTQVAQTRTQVTPSPTHVASSPAHTASPPARKSPSPSPSPTSPSASPAPASYASAPLSTSSSSVTARVYFGQLKAVVDALAGQVTFNTPASWLDDEPGRCALTVVFGNVANPTGTVVAAGLGSSWLGLEYTPSQNTEKGNLHQQIVTPPGDVSAGDSWPGSANLTAGSLKVTSATYDLQCRGTGGWVLNGQAVSCDA